MNNENKKPQADAIDINALTEELNTLKMAHTDLQNKYNDLENTYSTYKFDIEFQEDIKDIKKSIPDKDIDVLKELKKSGNDDAYNLLLDRYKVQGRTYLMQDKDGRFLPWDYAPGDGNSAQIGGDGDLFTSAINEVKGGR